VKDYLLDATDDKDDKDDAKAALVELALAAEPTPEPEPEAEPEPELEMWKQADGGHFEVTGELAWYKIERVKKHKPCRWHSNEAATESLEEAKKHLGEIRLCVRFAPKHQEKDLLKEWAKTDVAAGRIKARRSRPNSASQLPHKRTVMSLCDDF
jgi:hypothetical protein